MDFLALQEGTSIPGLLKLAVGPDTVSARTRAWSIARLLLMIVIPATGVVIMSKSQPFICFPVGIGTMWLTVLFAGQVDIQLAFTPIESQPTYFGFGNVDMNGTIGLEYTGFSDLLLSWKFSGFLQDPNHSVDLTPPSDSARVCGLATDSRLTGGCPRSYFIPGELVMIAPDIVLNSSFPEADVVLLNNHRGYVLDFDVGNFEADFDPVRDCRIYTSRYLGVQAGALRLCVWNSGSNELQIRKTYSFSYPYVCAQRI